MTMTNVCAPLPSADHEFNGWGNLLLALRRRSFGSVSFADSVAGGKRWLDFIARPQLGHSDASGRWNKDKIRLHRVSVVNNIIRNRSDRSGNLFLEFKSKRFA